MSELETSLRNIRAALEKWNGGHKLDLSGTDVEYLIEAYDALVASAKPPAADMRQIFSDGDNTHRRPGGRR